MRDSMDIKPINGRARNIFVIFFVSKYKPFLNYPEVEFKEFERRLKFKPPLKYDRFYLKFSRFKPVLN